MAVWAIGGEDAASLATAIALGNCNKFEHLYDFGVSNGAVIVK